MRYTLENSRITTFLEDCVLSEYHIVFVDSLDMPFHVFRDYIIVRVPVTLHKVAVETHSNLHNLDRALIFHSLDSMTTGIMFSTIYNNGIFSVSTFKNV